MASIIDGILAKISPDLVSKLAERFGEDRAAVARGLESAVPMLLAGVVEAAAKPNCLALLMPMLTAGPAGGLVAAIADPSALESWEAAGSGALPLLFPDTEHATAAVIGSGAGLKTETETALLAIAAPLVLAAVGEAAGPTPTPTSVRHLLAEQEFEIARRMPGELGRTLLDDVPPAKLRG